MELFMRLLLDRTIKMKPSDSKTNIDIPLKISEPYHALFIRTAYEPKITEDLEFARREIEAGIAKYVPEYARAEYGNWKDYLPLVNLITFSLDYEDEYIGCAHRHSPVMDHIISPEYSSAGFIRHAVTPGMWNCVLNCHAVVTETVSYSLKVYGTDANEEVHDYVQAF